MNLTDEQRRDIELSQADVHLTRRPISYGLEDTLYDAIPVLDHGFVRVVDYMGNDQAIVQAARVSYGTGTKHGSNDESLIRYLMRHWHTTPFEMCEIKLHVKLPVFVARQWIRHRTASVNEYSARYSILDREFYIPEPEQLAKQSTTNNQGRGEAYSEKRALDIRTLLEDSSEGSYRDYEMLVTQGPVPDHDVKDMPGYGLARELSRMVLPTNIYTQWYWKVDLHNLLHFLRLRADPHAQYEIRCYADAICKIVEAWVPYAYKAFEDYRLNAEQFSSQEMHLLRQIVSAWADDDGTSGFDNLIFYGLSKREAAEFVAKLTPPD